MGGEQAAGVLTTVKEAQLAPRATMSEEEIAEMKKPILEKYEKEGSAYYSTARLWDDGIIDPRKTREVLSMALSSTLHRNWPETKNGIFRM